MKKPLSRRRFLRGAIAGTTVALGLPTLEAMLTDNGAFAEGPEQQPFFGLFYWANGVPWHGEHGGQQAMSGKPDIWTPQQTGAGYSPSELLAPLAPHQVNIATGLQPHTDVPPQPPGQGDGHMRGFMVALTGDRPRSDDFNHSAHALTALRPSIDQVIARHPDFYDAQAPPRFRSLELGVSRARFHKYGHWNAISYNGPDSLNLPIMDPSALYDRLFGVPIDDQSSARRERLLDAVLDDARDLRGELGARDKQRLDRHLEHLDALRQQLQASSSTCTQPARPSDSGDIIARTRTMAKLLTLSINCGLTRIFSFMLTSPASTHVFNNLSVPDGMHKTCHDGHWERVRKITLYQMQAFAAFLEEFNVPGPTGEPLIDQGVILATTEYGEGWKHSVRELPMLLCGGGCGKLNKGVHTREKGGNLAKAHLTALRALDLNTESFGWNGGQTLDDIAGFLKA